MFKKNLIVWEKKKHRMRKRGKRKRETGYTGEKEKGECPQNAEEMELVESMAEEAGAAPNRERAASSSERRRTEPSDAMHDAML